MSEPGTFLPGAGWASRLRSTGRIAASAVRLGARRALGREGEQDAAIAADLTAELDRMKGMAMKVGQILSYFDGVLPEEAHAALRSLQRGTSHMEPGRARAVVEEALGAPVDALFEGWEDEPAAAASIGQVHRAEHHSTPVAVKVQYPGVARDLDADFGRLRLLGRAASLPSRVDGAAVVEELRARVAEECDYRAEAAAQEAFRRAFADDPAVIVPAVVPDRSAGVVLTTRWAAGRDVYAFAAAAGPDQRRAAALTLLRFAHRSFFHFAAVNADPHPGNYLFPGGNGGPATGKVREGREPHGDGGRSTGEGREGQEAVGDGPPGRVVFLDFGCVRLFDSSFVEDERQVALAVLEGRRRAFRDAVLEAGRVGEPRGFDWSLHWRALRHQYAPYLEPRFRFTAAWVREGMELNGPGHPNLTRLTFPPEWVWLQRLQWGLHAVLARLEAEGPFREVLLRWLHEETRPLRW